MRFIYISYIVLLFGCTPNRSSQDDTESTKTTNFDTTDTLNQYEISEKLGNTPIGVMIFQSGDPSICYFNMHDNENTSVEAAKYILRNHQGRLIELKAQGSRNIFFEVQNKKYVFDPNRMYTEKGITNTLNHNSEYSIEAHQAIRIWAGSILDIILKKTKILVAIHNNSGGFSIKSYLPGAEFAKNALKVSINPEECAGDFFYVNDIILFNYFQKIKYNVVLQDNVNRDDDGSLSVYCGNCKIPYVNVECENHHLQQQIKMLETLQLAIKETKIIN